MTADWRTAWTEALDALELDVTATEAMLAGEHLAAEHPAADPWQPPAAIGVIPQELRSRAAAILQRQLSAAEQASRQLVSNRQQQAMVARIETGGAAPQPIYLDRAL